VKNDIFKTNQLIIFSLLTVTMDT